MRKIKKITESLREKKKIAAADGGVLVEFSLKLKDRYGNEKELRGFVEEGTARNDAVAKLVRENGGFCEIREGENELAGLRWISRIEFSDGFKIGEWGQYATINGQFEVGKLRPSLMKKLLALFSKKFDSCAFWENGDTKKVTAQDSAVLFREDYGVKGELPRADAIIASKGFEPGGGCGGAITKGELELVKLAAAIDFGREEYLVDLNRGEIRKREQHDGQGEINPLQLEKILARPSLLRFDATVLSIKNGFDMPSLFPPDYNKVASVGKTIADKIIDYSLLQYRSGECGALGQHEFSGVSHGIRAAPDLFFSKYEKEIVSQASEEESEGEDEKTGREGQEDEEHASSAEEGEEETKEKGKKQIWKNQIGTNTESKPRREKASEAIAGGLEENDKILSIIRKLKSGAEEESNREEKRIWIGEEKSTDKRDTSVAGREKRKKKAKPSKKKNKPKKADTQVIRKKILLESKRGKKQPERKSKQKKANKKTGAHAAKTPAEYAKMPKPPRTLLSKEKSKQKTATENKNKKNVGRAKDDKTKQKIPERNITATKKPANQNPSYRKGTELAQKLFLRALKNIEKKKRATALLLANSKSLHKKPRHKV